MIYGKPRGRPGREREVPPRAGVLGAGNLCAWNSLLWGYYTQIYIWYMVYGIWHVVYQVGRRSRLSIVVAQLPNWASLWAILKNLPTLRAFVLCGLCGQNGSFTWDWVIWVWCWYCWLVKWLAVKYATISDLTQALNWRQISCSCRWGNLLAR